MRARKTSAWQISGLLILQPADDGGDVFCIDVGIAHHEHGVVASERARDALELGRIERHRDAARDAGRRAQHDEIVHNLDGIDQFAHHALQAKVFGQHIIALARFRQAHACDIARYGCLRAVVAFSGKLLDQVALGFDVAFSDNVTNYIVTYGAFRRSPQPKL